MSTQPDKVVKFSAINISDLNRTFTHEYSFYFKEYYQWFVYFSHLNYLFDNLHVFSGGFFFFFFFNLIIFCRQWSFFPNWNKTSGTGNNLSLISLCYRGDPMKLPEDWVMCARIKLTLLNSDTPIVIKGNFLFLFICLMWF